MIKHFRLLKNIGIFDYVETGRNIALGKLTLCYADNGRGKTTLASVLRSLADGNPGPITERKRLSSSHNPHIVIELDNNSAPLVFEDATWSGELASLVVFDDAFVEQNVHSGLTVSPQQRQQLHDLVLGPQAVALNRELDELVEKIETHTRELRNKEHAIPASVRGEFSIDDFCSLPKQSDIDQAIEEAERDLVAAHEQHEIGSTPAFDLLNLPAFDLSAIEPILQMDLDSLDISAYERVQDHLTGLGQNGEKWVSDGMHRIGQVDDANPVLLCPFCVQSLDASPIIQHYRTYFSDAYSDLKRTIADILEEINGTHGEGVQAEFERRLRTIDASRQFWTRFIDPEDFTVDTSEIFRSFRAAREAVLSLLTTKQASPLEKVQVPEEDKALVVAYERHLITIAEVNQRLLRANQAIMELKERIDSYSVETLSSKLKYLTTSKVRYSPEIAEACDDYLQELGAKSETEKARAQTRKKLDHHRAIVFPKYQAGVNQYLETFGAGFRLGNMKHANLRSGSTSTYDAQIGGASIPVGVSNLAPVAPSFGSVLSGGDRTTLAFAFFLASLDQRHDLADTIVVIDDPISSMDTDRSLTTAQEIRHLTRRAGQVIVLSHDKRFLCSIWESPVRAESAAFEIARSQEGSTLREWNVTEDSLTQHDRRHRVLQGYYDFGAGDQREVAREIRLHLEGFLRTACPQDFPPGRPLGSRFLTKCQETLGGDTEILSASKLQELRDILEYAHRFHHESEPITDGELRTFVGRTLKFAKP